jgi:hypothetical protein
MNLKILLRKLWTELRLSKQARQHRARISKKFQYIQGATAARGGQAARDAARRQRQAAIRQQKRAIIEGLLRSWSLGEIRRPPPETILELRYFSERKPLAQLQQMETLAWS